MRRQDSQYIAAQGFTIAEVFVVISMLALLAAIAVPALRETRATAIEHAELAHQREVGSMLRVYVNNHNGRFPYFGVPGTNSAPLAHPETGHEDWYDWYWGQPQLWGVWLWNQGDREFARMIMSGPSTDYELEHYQYTDATGTHDERSFWAEDILTHTAFANPSFWREDDPQLAEDHQPQRWNTIVHPSKKGILRRQSPERPPEETVDPVAGSVNPNQLVWFTDGHGAIYRERELRPGVPLRIWLPDGEPVLTTENGLLGRDVP